ncbi:MAG: hypothetical protein ACXWFN_12235 [Solirubrobacterales bacterium]
MKVDRRTLAIGVAALVLVALFVSPALGGPSLKKLVKKEVSKQLKGKQGGQGPPGAAGASATALFAGVNSDGSVSAQSGVVGNVAHTAASGQYTVTFNRNVDTCAPVATLTNDDPGEILASVLGGPNNTVAVFTRDSAGSAADGAFSVAVFC